MSTKVLIPKPGMGTTEGTVVRWHKAEGDPVVEGELLVDIETAKAVQEVMAPATGVLIKILVGEGETAEAHAEIGVIE